MQLGPSAPVVPDKARCDGHHEMVDFGGEKLAEWEIKSPTGAGLKDSQGYQRDELPTAKSSESRKRDQLLQGWLYPRPFLFSLGLPTPTGLIITPAKSREAGTSAIGNPANAADTVGRTQQCKEHGRRRSTAS
jgi:hypothetical protein